MTIPPVGPIATVLFAASILALVLLLTALLARAVRRSERQSHQRRASGLFQLLVGRMAGHVAPRELFDAVRDAQAENYWAAIEAITSTLRHRERRELARSLTRNPHARAARFTLRHDDDPARREQAARRLGLLPSQKSRQALRHALVKGPEGVRFTAARSLAAHRDLAALGWILHRPELLASRPIPALSGLFRAFGPGGRALLLAGLEHGVAVPRFECAMIDALGVARCRSARGALDMRLRSPHTEVRVAASRALGRLGMGESIPGLMLALADDAWAVRAQAAQALGRLQATPAIEPLLERVSDRSWWVRHHAAYALAILGPDGRDALCELVVRSPDAYAREMAREALDHAVQKQSA
jgi:HEAT repeat protein